MRERAIRLVGEVRDQYDSEWEAIGSVASNLGIESAETLRKWIRRSEVDAGKRPGGDYQESAEVRERCRAHEILMAAAGFFAAELDRDMPSTTPSAAVAVTTDCSHRGM